jgi:hypothetical protein
MHYRAVVMMHFGQMTAAMVSTLAFLYCCRLTGQQVDKRVMHADPEALMRALKARPSRPKQPAAAAEAADAEEQRVAGKEEEHDKTLPEQRQQQEEEQEQKQQESVMAAAADGDVDMADVAASAAEPAAGAAAAAAAAAAPPPAGLDSAAGTEAADVSTPAAAAAGAAANAAGASQQSSPLALKPVTNGQSRKRPADAADGERPAKVAASTADQQQQQQQRRVQPPVVITQRASGTGVSPTDAIALTGGAAGLEGELYAAPLDSQQPLLAVAAVAEAPKAADVAVADVLLQQLVAATHGMQLASLELLHARLSRVVAASAQERDRQAVLQRVGRVVAAVEQEQAGALSRV